MMRGYLGGMTAQPVEPPASRPDYPAKTLDGVVRVLTGDVDADVAQAFTAALSAAWAAAKAGTTLEPLTALVEAWWPQAVHWTEPDKAREHNARVQRYLRDGPPPASERFTHEQALALRAARRQHTAQR